MYSISKLTIAKERLDETRLTLLMKGLELMHTIAGNAQCTYASREQDHLMKDCFSMNLRPFRLSHFYQALCLKKVTGPNLKQVVARMKLRNIYFNRI